MANMTLKMNVSRRLDLHRLKHVDAVGEPGFTGANITTNGGCSIGAGSMFAKLIRYQNNQP